MTEENEINKISEPKFRINRKQNFKGETAFEYTIRGDTQEEMKMLDKQALEIAKRSHTEIILG